MFRIDLAGAVVASALFIAGSAFAQDTPPEIADQETAWSIYVADNPKECFLVSTPTSWSAQRAGESVTVSRSEIRFYISIIPSEDVNFQPAFLAGYPLKPDATVEMSINDDTFTLHPNADLHREYAWPRPDDDAGLIEAMKGGSEATVIGTSTRGTVTTDLFSLIGFTAAIEKAVELCQ